MPVFAELKRLRQEDYEFDFQLSFGIRSCTQSPSQNKTNKRKCTIKNKIWQSSFPGLQSIFNFLWSSFTQERTKENKCFKPFCLQKHLATWVVGDLRPPVQQQCIWDSQLGLKLPRAPDILWRLIHSLITGINNRSKIEQLKGDCTWRPFLNQAEVTWA